MTVPVLFFWIGVLMTALIFVISLIGKEETKRGASFTPFFFLVAAAVAKYLGL